MADDFLPTVLLIPLIGTEENLEYMNYSSYIMSL